VRSWAQTSVEITTGPHRNQVVRSRGMAVTPMGKVSPRLIQGRLTNGVLAHRTASSEGMTGRAVRNVWRGAPEWPPPIEHL
jgi:hypothetical protein